MLSLDQEKAFDRVSHSFLIKTLEKFGFGPKFINWIKVMYTDCKSFVQNNGHLSGQVDILRGIRQGCPISCFLYIITSETLSQAIRKDTQIHGYKLPHPSMDQLEISQSADDTLNLIRYEDHIRNKRSNTRKSLTRLLEKLQLYQKASGSKLNLEKTQIRIFGGIDYRRGISNYKLTKLFNDAYKDLLQSEAKSIDDGIEVLGVHFMTSPAARFQKNFTILKEKITKKLNFLSTRKLSIKGRAIALNTLVLSKFWYIASVISMTNASGAPIPDDESVYKKLLKEINTKIANFIWQTDNVKPIAIETLYKPISKGGLGILDIQNQALALRSKQIAEALNICPAPLPSQIFARTQLVDLNGRDGTGHIRFFKPYTGFLEQYKEQPAPNIDYTLGFGYPNYKSLIVLAQKLSHLYDNPDKPPSCKNVYKSLLAENTQVIAGERKWVEKLGIKPDWSNTWLTHNNNKQKETFWKVKHFILNLSLIHI